MLHYKLWITQSQTFPNQEKHMKHLFLENDPAIDGDGSQVVDAHHAWVDGCQLFDHRFFPANEP